MMLPMLGIAQRKGVQFLLDPIQAREIARQEKKPLLVVWFNESNEALQNRIFGDPYVERFLTQHFVNVKQVGKSKYNWLDQDHLSTSPVCLVFDSDGTLIHRVSETSGPLAFLQKIKKSLDISSQYYALMKKSDEGDRSPDLLEKLIVAAADAQDTANLTNFLQRYADSQPEPFSLKQVKFLTANAMDSRWPGFQRLVEAASTTDAANINGLREKITALIFQEMYLPQLTDKSADVSALVRMAKAKYPHVYLAQYLDEMAIEFCERREDWATLQNVLPAYVEAYAQHITPGMLNYYAYLVHEYMANDKDLVKKACDWSKSSIAATAGKNTLYLETYAKLLDKAGFRDEPAP